MARKRFIPPMGGTQRAIIPSHLVATSPAPTPAPTPAPAPVLAPATPVSTIDPLLLTIADVCALLNVSRSTIDRLDKSGKLPGRVKLGGQVRYHREVLEQWLKQQTEQSQ